MRYTTGLFGAFAALLLAAQAAPAQVGGAGGQGGLAPPALQQPFQPGGQVVDPQKMQEMMREMMRKQFEKAMGMRLDGTLGWGGMTLEPAGEALRDQLSIPADQGLIVASVEADSPAAKAGFKKYDVLVKVNGQGVPGTPTTALKALEAVKADTPADLVVVRKGKEEAIKGIKLPQAAMSNPTPFGPAGGFNPGAFGPGGGFNPLPPNFQPFPPGGGLKPLPLPFKPGNLNLNGVVNGARVTVNRNDDQFTAELDKDKVHITVRGKVDGKQARADEITVKDGDETKKYQKVEDVPQAYRDQVNQLLQSVVGNGLQLQFELRPLPLPNLPNPDPFSAPGK
jgi:hypothetical protein